MIDKLLSIKQSSRILTMSASDSKDKDIDENHGGNSTAMRKEN